MTNTSKEKIGQLNKLPRVVRSLVSAIWDVQIGVGGRLRVRVSSSEHAHFEIFRLPNLKRVLSTENSYSYSSSYSNLKVAATEPYIFRYFLTNGYAPIKPKLQHPLPLANLGYLATPGAYQVIGSCLLSVHWELGIWRVRPSQGGELDLYLDGWMGWGKLDRKWKVSDDFFFFGAEVANSCKHVFRRDERV